jgi:hypothetical protein
MTPPIPQRTVTLTVIGTDHHATVSYSYWSPVTGHTYTHAPTCELVCKTATDTLFVLDYRSAAAGWTLLRTRPNHTPALDSVLGPKQLSLMTIDPYSKDITYKFYIDYVNTVTEASISIDPQEGNDPPMVG